MTILTDGIYTVTSACVYVLMVVVVYCEVLCVLCGVKGCEDGTDLTGGDARWMQCVSVVASGE